MLCCFEITPATQSISVEIPILYDTLEGYIAKEGGELFVYFWRPILIKFFPSLSFYLSAIKYKPTHIFLSSYTSRYHYMPSLSTLHRLKSRGIEVQNIWWDTCSKKVEKAFLDIDPYVSRHIVLDNPCKYFLEKITEKLRAKNSLNEILYLYYPLQYNRSLHSKDIDVVFLGQTGSYRSVRQKYLNYLQDMGRPIFTSKNFKGPVTEVDYNRILLRSKIGINFSESVDSHQLKARVFELIKSGCLLIEQRNEQTAKYFTEGEDYVAFSSKEELLEKVMFYLDNESLREQIISAAYKKASQKYNGDMFWQSILIKVAD
jgi:hypothetical protein